MNSGLINLGSIRIIDSIFLGDESIAEVFILMKNLEFIV